ncbi:MAG: hypothetical protein Q4D61_06670 [Cardiobacteriaceae bacterium]|nr:hypothetical protein [Cardiobacteriaceae bacterium]
MKKALILACSLALGTLSAGNAAMLYETAQPEIYVRLPSQWQLLWADARRDEAALAPHWKAVQEKLAALPTKATELSEVQSRLLDEFLARIDSGLELGFYLGKNGAFTLAMRFHYTFRDEAEFFAWWQAFVKEQDATLSGNGKEGRITLDNGEAAAYRFDAATGRVEMLFAPQLPQTPDWTPFSGEGDPSLKAAAADIDPNGDGFLLWSRNNPVMLAALGGESTRNWVKALQLLKLKSVALGYGVAGNGRPRLQFNAEIAEGGLRDFLPLATPASDLAVHGELQSLYAFTLPDAAQMKKILRIIEQGTGSTENLYNLLQTELGTAFALDLATLFDALGGQWTVINDDFGTVFAAPQNPRFDAAIAMLEKAGFARVAALGDSGLHHLRLDPAPLMQKDANLAQQLAKNPLLNAIVSVPYHFYWQDEGDYRVFATLPNPMMYRARSKSGKSVASQLALAGIDAAQNNAYAMSSIDHLARQHYYSRLRWLQYLADVAGVDVSLEKLPSPHMLNLPVRGHIGAAISGDTKNLRVQIHLENSLFDLFHEGGASSTISTVAVAGILAAIALPAYQDYIERRQTALFEPAPEMDEAEIAEIQQTIETAYLASAALRDKIDRNANIDEADIAAVHDAIPGIVEYEADYGLYFTFTSDAPPYLQESTLIIHPVADEDSGKTRWYCYLEDPYLQGDALVPAICSPYEM